MLSRIIDAVCGFAITDPDSTAPEAETPAERNSRRENTKLQDREAAKQVTCSNGVWIHTDKVGEELGAPW